jgi:hypothetical protein
MPKFAVRDGAIAYSLQYIDEHHEKLAFGQADTVCIGPQDASMELFPLAGKKRV